MKLTVSEAIALGSTVIRPVQFTTGQDDYGCAAGMATYAATGMQNTLGNVWPWCGESLKAPMPCGCKAISYPPDDPAGRGTYPITCYSDAIAHLFNEHVMGDKEWWSLEQLIDYVRSVEPDGSANDLPIGSPEAAADRAGMPLLSRAHNSPVKCFSFVSNEEEYQAVCGELEAIERE